MSNTNSMIAHMWVNQSKGSARSSNGTFWFGGDFIYSYRTIIGRIVRSESGQTAYMVTSRTYTVTTEGKHKGSIWNALPRNAVVFRVPDVCQGYDHAANFADYAARHIEELKKASNARTHGATYLAYAETLRLQANAYAEFFGLESRIEQATDIAALLEQAKRIAALEEAKKQEALQERLQRWLNGENVSVYEVRPVRLRAVGDTLETTQGATVPLADAIRIFRIAASVKRVNPKEPVIWTTRDNKPHVGSFQVDRIDADGTIHAGCHTITFEESARLASLLGVTANA